MQSAKPRPNTPRAVERCSLLFQVATDLFLTYGFNQVSLDQIVEHAGGSKATIYKYFGSKTGLFLAICEERSNKFIHQVKLACQHSDVDIRQNLSNLLFNLYTVFSDLQSQSFGRLIFQLSIENPVLAHEIYNLGPRRAHHLLAELLKNAHDQGLIYCKSPEDSAIYFFGFFHDMHWRTLVGLPIIDSSFDIQHHINYVVDRFIEGHQAPVKD